MTSSSGYSLSKPETAKCNGGLRHVGRDPLIFLSRAPCISAPFWTLDQEIFENEFTLTAIHGTAATHACYFAISRRHARGFDPNDLVLCRAVWTLKLCRPAHSQKNMGSGRLKRSDE